MKVYIRSDITENAESDDYLTRRVEADATNDVDALEYLAFDPMECVRCQVAQNSNTPVEILEMLAEDESSYVRLCIALRSEISLPTLIKLAKDSNYEVRCAVYDNPNFNKLPENIKRRLEREWDD